MNPLHYGPTVYQARAITGIWPEDKEEKSKKPKPTIIEEAKVSIYPNPTSDLFILM
jgi:hypothetical protein